MFNVQAYAGSVDERDTAALLCKHIPNLHIDRIVGFAKLPGNKTIYSF